MEIKGKVHCFFEQSKEEWRDIKGFEGLYQVSNLGRVRSLDHYVKNGHGNRLVHGKILKPYKSSHGYLFVALGKKAKHRSVHRDSVAVHIRDTFHNRSIFDSLTLTLATHDTIFRVERIIKEITNDGARTRDTSFVSRRDTVVVHQTSRPADRDFSWLGLIVLWFAGVIVSVIIDRVWRYPK